MSRIYVQCEGPKYENMLPAHAKLDSGKTLILWESYIDHRSARPVYLSSCEGRFLVVPESAVVGNTVTKIKLAEDKNATSEITDKEI